MNSAYLSASTTEPVAIIRREEEVDIILKQLLLPTRDIPSTVAAPTTTPKSLVRIPLYAILAICSARLCERLRRKNHDA